jgi:magnesium transporter
MENPDQTEAQDMQAPTLDEDFALNPDFVDEVCAALHSGQDARVRELFGKLHIADQADLLGLVRSDQRRGMVRILGEALDPEALPELDDDIRDDVLEVLPTEELAAAVEELDSDDAVHLLEDLDQQRQAEVLERVGESERAAVELGLQYADETAGRLMQRDFLSVPPYWTVGQTLDHLKSTIDLPDMFFEIFVADPSFHAIGTIPVSRLLRADPAVLVGEIMNTRQTLIPTDMDEEEVAYLFNQYHLISAAVVDEDNRIVGMITVDDIVDVVRETASEDMLALGGVKEEEGLSDSVITTTRSRFSWLVVNLLTAISASIVIAFFHETIERAVALAVLMPIVASMGGNAGTQTLTVAIRALATKDLTPTNAARIVVREVLVGGLNGVIFALLMGVIGGFWFNDLIIGVVLGLAMIINLLFAGFAGIMVPLGLEKAGIDPAVASSVFVTTITDIVGFFVFLGLATLVLFQ